MAKRQTEAPLIELLVTPKYHTFVNDEARKESFRKREAELNALLKERNRIEFCQNGFYVAKKLPGFLHREQNTTDGYLDTVLQNDKSAFVDRMKLIGQAAKVIATDDERYAFDGLSLRLNGLLDIQGNELSRADKKAIAEARERICAGIKHYDKFARFDRAPKRSLYARACRRLGIGTHTVEDYLAPTSPTLINTEPVTAKGGVIEQKEGPADAQAQPDRAQRTLRLKFFSGRRRILTGTSALFVTAASVIGYNLLNRTSTLAAAESEPTKPASYETSATKEGVKVSNAVTPATTTPITLQNKPYVDFHSNNSLEKPPINIEFPNDNLNDYNSEVFGNGLGKTPTRKLYDE